MSAKNRTPLSTKESTAEKKRGADVLSEFADIVIGKELSEDARNNIDLWTG